MPSGGNLRVMKSRYDHPWLRVDDQPVSPTMLWNLRNSRTVFIDTLCQILMRGEEIGKPVQSIVLAEEFVIAKTKVDLIIGNRAVSKTSVALPIWIRGGK